MLRFLVFIFLFSGAHAQLQFSETKLDLGTIKEAYEIKGDVIIKNSSERKVFLLRADADKGVKVYASKKTLLSGDTALLIISFIPDRTGKFNKKISLISSDSETPYFLELRGNLEKLKADDKLACYYFGSRKRSNVKVNNDPIIVTESSEPKDISNKIPDDPYNPYRPIITFTAEPESVKPPESENKKELSVLEYKPNNILFLVDVSSSMKDSLKMPLMKQALYVLIDAVRDIDKITFVTYADSIKLLKEAVKGSNKDELRKIVDSLKAKGMTKGNKAILRSQDIIQKHFIKEGNNQIILATDGKFRFYADDQKKWNAKQTEKKIILTTVAFGNDKEAIKNLKSIAMLGEGSFIHFKKKSENDEKLLDEIKLRSKR